MSIRYVTGIDPGLVDTGVVSVLINTEDKKWAVSHAVCTRATAEDIVKVSGHATSQHYVFIEAYRPRSHFATDQGMVTLVKEIAAAAKGKVLSNIGIKNVVRQPLMELLDIWNFGTRTNHDDLRSAARILLLGMLKDEELNEILYDIVNDYSSGTHAWSISHM